MKKAVLIPFSVMLIMSYAAAQNNLSQTFTSGNFEKCIAQCDSLLKKDDQNAQANFFKGASLTRIKEYEEAIRYLLLAKQNNYQSSVPVNINLLRAYAGNEETNRVLNILDTLAHNGFTGIKFLNNLPEFSYLNENKQFSQLREKVKANAFPCLYNDIYKKLDFWLGEWDIFVNGTKSADSKITKSYGGCILYEDYKTLSGFSGQSTNYYDAADSLYKQIWIDRRNNITHFIENESRLGFLSMLSTTGTSRMTYEYDPENDEVSQTVERTVDGGETWALSFAGLYRRKNPDLLKNELIQLLNNMEELFAQNKMEKIADYYTEDAQILEPGGKVHTGKEQIKTYWKILINKGVSWNLRLIETEPGAELVSSIVRSDLRYKLNGKEELSSTKALIIWKKTKNGYKIHKDFFHFIK